MIIPVGSKHSQQIRLITKDEKGNLNEEELIDVRYVPLTSKENQCGEL
jgi:protein-L-isoaspartate O-methyltransferase